MSVECINRVRMEQLMITKQLDTVMDHIEGCTTCSQRLRACMEESLMMKEALFSSQPDEQFTAQVMARIFNSQAPFADIETPKLNNVQGLNRKGRLLRVRWPLITAAVMLLVLISMCFTQPTVANWIKSLFGTADTIDVSLLHAEQLGIHHFANIKVTDKGYTLEIKEVVADTARALIAYRLTDPNGKVDNNRFNADMIEFIDALGNSLDASVTGREPLGELTDTGYDKTEYEVAKFMFKNAPETDIVHMRGNINYIGHASEKPEFHDLLRGDWSFALDINMGMARKQMQVIPLHGANYTAPDGTQIAATQLIYHSSAYQIEFQTKLSRVAAKSSTFELPYAHQLGFYMEDQGGNKIGRVNYNAHHKDEDYRSSLGNMYCRNDNKGSSDVISCTYTIYNIRENVPDPARIVIKNYNLPVQTTDSITINLAQLKTQAAVWKTQGDVLTVEEVVGFADSRPYVKQGKGTSLKLIVSGVFVNNFTYDEWVAVDENGHDYQVYINGGGSASYHHLQDDRMTFTLSGGTPDERPFALIDGMQHVPQQLTLTRKVTDKLFTGLNWSIPLPVRIHVK